MHSINLKNRKKKVRILEEFGILARTQKAKHELFLDKNTVTNISKPFSEDTSNHFLFKLHLIFSIQQTRLLHYNSTTI